MTQLEILEELNYLYNKFAIAYNTYSNREALPQYYNEYYNGKAAAYASCMEYVKDLRDKVLLDLNNETKAIEEAMEISSKIDLEVSKQYREVEEEQGKGGTENV